MRKSRSQQGVTLIELLIVVTIAGILAMSALPAYQAHQQKAYLRQAQADLIMLQLAIEQQRSQGQAYPAQLSAALCPACRYDNPFYSYRIALESGTYRLWAESKDGEQECGSIALLHNGTTVPPECW
ncbi:type IV pilin protein [Photobacterium halotolerans]|uniref:Prepilin-type N-terminal cleavage/methylation domain-containing protein n=1 Tax=Photobacterium halotolerans TaxID=265726 RepID=A0A7X5BLJ4_9GAMM|nr:type IV pilin protein [Photobacterium halotolerans]NAW64944.1 prepilin-type N-terminal cleavage/methylation domain-containing protein [Photobacterium halotolerans]NAX47764.1 prepilin-type N-terminal cleavage/methylation domain-containing protein [Photobacterium halotolerans]